MSDVVELRDKITVLEEELDAVYELNRELEEKLGDAQSGVVAPDADLVRMEEALQALDEENEQLRGKLDEERANHLQSRDEVTRLNAQIESEAGDKKQLADEKSRLEEEIAELKREMKKERTKAQRAARRDADVDKNSRHRRDELASVMTENTQLMQEVRQLTEEVKALTAAQEELASALEILSEEKDELATSKEDLLDEKEEIENELSRTKEELKEMQLAVQVSNDLSTELETQLNTERERMQRMERKGREEVRALKGQIAQLTEQMDLLKDTTAMGQKDRELSQLRQEVAAAIEVGQRMAEDRDQALSDLEALSKAIEETREGAEQRVFALVVEERQKKKVLESQVQTLESHLKEERDRYTELERLHGELQVDYHEAEEWKRIYEAKHGMADSVRYQKKLKADLKRTAKELTAMNERVSELVEQNENLLATCARLKEECGRPKDFWYDGLEVKEHIAGETARLKAVIDQLEKQNDSLEIERENLLRQLRDNAAIISEKGIKFVGLTPEQLLKVNEFARNIRDGTLQLPLDDRSKELKTKLRELERESERYQDRMSMLEAELEERDGGAGRGAMAVAEGEMSSLRNDIRRLMEENTGLAETVHRLQHDLPEAIARATSATAEEQSRVIAEVANLQALAREKVEALEQEHGPDARRREEEHRASAEERRRAREEEVTAAQNQSLQALLMQNQQLTSQLQSIHEAHTEELRRISEQIDTAVGANNNNTTTNNNNSIASNQQQEGSEAAEGLPRNLPPLYPLQFHQQGLVSGAPGQASGSLHYPLTVSQMSRGGGGAAAASQGHSGAAFFPTATGATGASLFGTGVLNGGGSGVGLRTPTTPHGKALLQKQLQAMQLPPEEWADEVKDLNAQLVECLEQLESREEELDEHEELLSRYEKHLVTIRQQLAVLYREHVRYQRQAETAAAAAEARSDQLLAETESLKVKNKNLEELVNLMEKTGGGSGGSGGLGGGGPGSALDLHRKLQDLSRRVTVHEVNEQVLTRKYASLVDALKREAELRQTMRNEVLEAEAYGKRRILYLELWKQGALSWLDRLQAKLSESVPKIELDAAMRELNCMREAHLILLQSESKVRVQLAEMKEMPRTINGLHQRCDELEGELAKAVAEARTSKESALHQEEVTKVTISGLQAMQVANSAAPGHSYSSSETASIQLSSLVSEVAKFRGEASRLEVELVVANKRIEQLSGRLQESESKEAQTYNKLIDTEAALRQALKRADNAARSLVEVSNQYEGGCTALQAQRLRAELDEVGGFVDGLRREVTRYKELADISSHQSATLESIRKDNTEEVASLRAQLVDLQSRTDDDVIIGKLQRQLISLKTSYRTFARKFDVCRSNLRRQQANARIMEARLDSREEAYRQLMESSSDKIRALTGALKEVSEMNLAQAVAEANGDQQPNNATVGATTTAGSVDAAEKDKAAAAAAANRKSGFAMPKAVASIGGIFDNRSILYNAARTGAHLRILTEALESREVEGKSLQMEISRLKGQAADLIAEKEGLETLVTDLRGLVEADGYGDQGGAPSTSGSTKRSAASGVNQKKMRDLAKRLMVLSEEVRSHKLESMQARREVAMLRDEKRHLESVVSGHEDLIVSLEEQQVELEARHLLEERYDQQYQHGGSSVGDDGSSVTPSTARGGGGGGGGGAHGSPDMSTSSTEDLHISLRLESPNDRRRNLRRIDERGEGQDTGFAPDEDGDGYDDDLKGGARRGGGDGHAFSDEDGDNSGRPLSSLSVEELVERIYAAREELAQYAGETSKLRSDKERLEGRCDALEADLKDADSTLSYYERRIPKAERVPRLARRTLMLADGRGPPLTPSDGNGTVGSYGTPQSSTPGSLPRSFTTGTDEDDGGRSESQRSAPIDEEVFREFERERERERHMAKKYIASLKHLLDEKTRACDRYKAKLEQARANARSEGMYGRAETEKMADALYKDNAEAVEQLRGAVVALERAPDGGVGGGGEAGNRLLEQLEETAAILAAKEDTIRQLELKLRTAEHSRIRAEERCGNALAEMEKMKSDLMTLAAQLQDAEERTLQALENPEMVKEIDDLKKSLRNKDSKLRELRSALVRLKQEFVRAEERRQVVEEENRKVEFSAVEDNSAALADEIGDLKRQIHNLQNGLAEAKNELETAKRGREKAVTARRSSIEENERLSEVVAENEKRMARMEANMAQSRKHLEEARRREAKLRDRIKAGGGGGEAGGRDEDDDGDDDESLYGEGRRNSRGKVAELERRIQVLMAQNDALRSAASSTKKDGETTPNRKGAKKARTADGDDTSATAAAVIAAATAAGAGGGGGGPGNGGGLPEAEIARRVRQAVWEVEKKTKRRVEVLENRLEVAKKELDAAEGAGVSAKDTMAKAMKEREALRRRVQELERASEGSKKSNFASADDLEATRERVFELESLLAEAQRKADLLLPQQVEAVREENRQLKARLREAEEDVEDALNRARNATAKAAATGGGNRLGRDESLRASEDRYMAESSLREELAELRRQRRDLEGTILARDASAVELKFDLEAKDAELDRMRRRLAEIQEALRAARAAAAASGATVGGSGGGLTGGVKGKPAGDRFRRERDLEGVVDAMKRVIEKLRAENDRLKRIRGDDTGNQGGDSPGGGGGLPLAARLADADRRARDARQRADRLQAENEALRSKITAADVAGQRAAQAKEAAAQLRRRLKERDDEIRDLRTRCEDLERSKSALIAEVDDTNRRMDGAEREAGLLRRRGGPPGGAGGSLGLGETEELRLLRDRVKEKDGVIRNLRVEVRTTNDRVGVLQRDLDRLTEIADRNEQRIQVRTSGTDVATMAAENRRLKEENARLARELQSFDLDFFEEIEDLKFKYAEAVKKLAIYER